MFKKASCIIMAIALAVAAVIVPVSATGTKEYVINLENGDYIQVVISESPARGNKAGSTVYTYRNADSEAQWQAVLRAVFQFDGSTSKATSSVCNVTIYNSAWSMDAKTCSVSGNTAYAKITMAEHFLGATVYSDTFTLSLTCDKDGNLS